MFEPRCGAGQTKHEVVPRLFLSRPCAREPVGSLPQPLRPQIYQTCLILAGENSGSLIRVVGHTNKRGPSAIKEKKKREIRKEKSREGRGERESRGNYVGRSCVLSTKLALHILRVRGDSHILRIPEEARHHAFVGRASCMFIHTHL